MIEGDVIIPAWCSSNGVGINIKWPRYQAYCEACETNIVLSSTDKTKYSCSCGFVSGSLGRAFPWHSAEGFLIEQETFEQDLLEFFRHWTGLTLSDSQVTFDWSD